MLTAPKIVVGETIYTDLYVFKYYETKIIYI